MSSRKIKIAADSASDTLSLDDIPFASAPMKIITAQKEYIDNDSLDAAVLVNDLASCSGKSGTACPGPDDWLKAFGDADEVFCVTITGVLSGSHNSAQLAKQDYEGLHPGRRVFVIDSLSAGPEIRLLLEKLRDLILSGKAFEEICSCITEYQSHADLLFMLESLNNMANNGRVSRLVAGTVGTLGIRIIGKASDGGTLEPLHKCRSQKKSLSVLAEQMEKLGYRGGRVRIGHCFNPEAAKELQAMILSRFPAASVLSYPLRGLCSYYAEKGGLLVGFEH